MTRRVTGPLLACLGCAVALAVVALLAFKAGPVEHADASLLHHLMAARDSASFDVAWVVAHLAEPLPLLAIVGVVCGLGLRWGRRRETIAAVGVVIGANLTTQVLKHLLDHHRFSPQLDVYQPWHNAFPSGHTTAAVSVLVALLLVAPPSRRALAALIGGAFAALIAIAVMVIEWHYPSDVIGGALVAAGWGFAALAALRLVELRSVSPASAAAGRLSPPAASPSP